MDRLLHGYTGQEDNPHRLDELKEAETACLPEGVRAHWSVENSAHGALEVVFAEDAVGTEPDMDSKIWRPCVGLLSICSIRSKAGKRVSEASGN